MGTLVTTTEAIYGSVLARGLMTHPIMGLPQLARGLSHVLRQPEPKAMEENSELKRTKLLKEIALMQDHPSKHLPFRTLEQTVQWYLDNEFASTVNCYNGAESYSIPMSTIESELYSIRDRLFEIAGEIGVACNFQLRVTPSKEIKYAKV